MAKRITTKIISKAAAAEASASQVSPAAAPASTPKGKLGQVVEMLRRPDGARIDELTAATGWQAHSVRGALSGALKKKLGLTISSEKGEAGRVYRIVEGAGA